MNGKKILALALVSMALCGGSVPYGASVLPSFGVAQAAETKPVWQEDIDEATRDDTMAFGIYIGKSMDAFISDFQKRGWTRADENGAVVFTKKYTDYAMMVAVHPHSEKKTLVGNYRIRFYGKTRDIADEMYMRAEKNFAYNFGRPNLKRGTSNMTWFLNDSFSIVVEYNEYDARMPLVKRFFPYEIVIKREVGDFSKFFRQ